MSITSAQPIDFELTGLLPGNLGTFASPEQAGIELKSAYTVISEWNDDFQIVSGVTRNGIDFNHVVSFDASGSWMEFGPLAEGSFFFMMLTESTGSANNYASADCEAQVYNSLGVQLGSTESFSVSNASPANGMQFCNLSQLVPANGYVKIKSSVTNFRRFFIDVISGTGSPLPVELTSFRSYLKDASVELQWTTATELNNYGFEVQRSGDGSEWSAIGFISGSGTRWTPRDYSYSDSRFDRSNPLLYYRLKQIDLDGRTEYSPILRVALNTPSTVSLSAYPQPFNDNLSVALSAQGGGEHISLSLYNSAMQKVAMLFEGQVEGAATMTLPTANLRDGSYFLVLSRSNGESQVQKLLRLRQ
ncbi:MAG: hypothetical protein IH600_00475 [Bacteroidetes bacterium]|nr:hypothetical protein [Bacteroidota bacterium]